MMLIPMKPIRMTTVLLRNADRAALPRRLVCPVRRICPVPSQGAGALRQ
jgi:hypothetical protein